MNADVNGTTRKIEVFYSNAMLENLCRIAKVYQGIVEYYKPDPIVGEAVKLDEAVTRVMKEWAKDEKVKQNRSMDQGQWVESMGGKLMRKVMETPYTANGKEPEKTTEQKIEEAHNKLKTISFKVNIEFGGVSIGLMNENRMQAVATIIIPRGPFTVAKNPYSIRIGVYGFGMTTTSEIPSLYAYAMVGSLTLERQEQSRAPAAPDGGQQGDANRGGHAAGE